MSTQTVDPRYPVGRFAPISPATDGVRGAAIADIEALPARLRDAVRGLTDAQLDTPYRDGGWTVRQVVHHLADSHVNAYVRLKLALTEDAPLIKPYDENAWASLPDSRLPIEPSLAIIDGVHARWVVLLRGMTPAQFERPWRHPEYGDTPVLVDRLVQVYAWHSRHHVAHVTTLAAREGW
jgi:hypothetical protein